MPHPDIDFRQIRPHGQPPSRTAGYEELASVLIEQGIPGVAEWPDGVVFYRFGNPDGGREGRGALPDGDVWAWQAKYLFQFDASAIGQVARSIRRVLDTEPNLTRYFVALPLNLPAGDNDGTTSAHTRWMEKVVEWQDLAAQTIGHRVDFTFVSEHDQLTVLTEPRHAGRAKYWFGAEILTPEWQRHRLNEAIAKVGGRYTPEVHVEVDPVRALDAIGRTQAFVHRWQELLADIRSARRWSWRTPAEPAAEFTAAFAECDVALPRVDEALRLMIDAACSREILPLLENSINAGHAAISTVGNLLYEHALQGNRYFVGDAAFLHSSVRRIDDALANADELSRWVGTRAARQRVLLMAGRGGVGKTHLLCDVAERRLAEGRPSLLLLGQDFDSRSLLQQISEQTQIGGTLDEVLATLDAAGEAAGCIALLMIDALNEGERPERWNSDVPALVSSAARYPHLALVLSCRTEYIGNVLGEVSLPTVEHTGFAESTDVAVHRYANQYGLEPPTFPLLNPEFGNPFYLKLTCEALVTLGAERFPFGSAGLQTVCTAFLEAVNRRLAQPSRCDFDNREQLVANVIRNVSHLGAGPWTRDAVRSIADAALPNRNWSQSLMRGLITEGVLNELDGGRITFGYQRLGDVMRAEDVVEKPVEEIKTWLDELGDDVWREHGLICVLGVLLPERQSIEIVDLAADSDGSVGYDIIDSFLDGLVLREPESVTPRAVEIVERLIDDSYHPADIWELLLRVACVPGHLLNARFLDAHLGSLDVPDRDLTWSKWLVGQLSYDESTVVSRLARWAWPSDLQKRPKAPAEVTELAVLVFGWFLSTSDRRVRDHATKAIVSVAERVPAAFAASLRQFRGTNDPYVLERLTAAACGIVLRTQLAETRIMVADSVAELVADEWPTHLMTRDYIRRVYAAARTYGWSGPEGVPPYESQWPVDPRSLEEIEKLTAAPDYAYDSIWNSLSGTLGDFGHYVVEPALRDIAVDNPAQLEDEVKRAIFDRVLELGWTPERFEDFDRGRSADQDHLVERIGKKYQWIAFYETLGRVADNFSLKAEFGDARQRAYERAEQLVWRDIDPTVLARGRQNQQTTETPWFSPADVHFRPNEADQYPQDMVGVPDPLDLITVTEPNGVSWLVLVGNPDWELELTPELAALDGPSARVWMQLHAYLIPTTQAEKLSEWASRKDWHGRWMPDTPEQYNVLLGWYPDPPDWSSAEGHVDRRRVGSEYDAPVELLNSAAWYGGTGTSRDKSAPAETTGHLPSKALLDLLDLSRGVDFAWRDEIGIAVYDPSLSSNGSSVLAIRRDLLPKLETAGFTIFWTVLVGRDQIRRDYVDDDDYSWVSASASYILRARQVEKIAAQAFCRSRNPDLERAIEWATRQT